MSTPLAALLTRPSGSIARAQTQDPSPTVPTEPSSTQLHSRQQEKPATPKPPEARFTPQQVADSLATRTSTQIDPRKTPKYRLEPILGKKHTVNSAPSVSPGPHQHKRID
jgi:hypothetical protein